MAVPDKTLPSLDSVPIAYLSTQKQINTLEVPDVVQIWLTNLVDTMNEALLDINARLIAGGL